MQRGTALFVFLVLALAGTFLAIGVGRAVWPSGEREVSQPQVRRTYDRAPLLASLADAGFSLGDPAFVRIFKTEKRLEVWLQPAGEERYRLFRSYDICKYSGTLGPKLKEGDRQAPEGFYAVSKAQLNPNSRQHLAFNLGFPNEYDRALGRTGSFLMVHGGCSSAGCYAVTDEKIDEIYAMIEAALDAGQAEVQVQAFPFDMDRPDLVAGSGGQWSGFWRNLKQGYDLFERDGVPPRAGVCAGRYVFGDELDKADCTLVRGWRRTASSS